MSDYTLKPCPFCGGQADIENIGSGEVEDEYFYMISCEECGASACFGDDSETKDGAISKWNRRVKMYVDNSNKEKVKKIKNRNDMKIDNTVYRQGTELYKCPRCDSYIRANQNYCSECGQALDWSE